MNARWICSALVALVGCRETELHPVEPPPPSVTTFGKARLLPLTATTLRIGSDDPEAGPDEKPGWVRFTRDIWMDTTEMTQSEYAALVGRNPSRVRGEVLPVTDVSWFDAVLAANARSRRDGFDTAYEYSSVRTDSAGVAIDLPGLAVHFDRGGWRLPTEAEWEAAARAGTTSAYAWGSSLDFLRSVEFAWSQLNSGGKPHATGTLRANAWGLHDMAGNVMEWVGDWKGQFPTDTIANFAGQELPGDVPEVPLKGGAYNYGNTYLRPSSRTATYAAFRSSRAEYVGFRLVRGGFAARFANASGSSVQVSPVSLSASSLPRILGAVSARLVFINRTAGKGTLSWVDYAEPSPIVRSLPDPEPVFHPSISPDGQWVAWSTAMEGSTGPSKVKARRLSRKDTVVVDLGEGAIPRWWVSGTDTFLVVAKALDNSSSDWRGTRTTVMRWSNGSAGARQTWTGSGSYHDGRSGTFAYTGYRRLRQLNIATGTERVLFTAPQNGKADGDTSQVCNVSAAPDGSGRVLFLDFGYTGTSKVVGRPYGIHETAFIADSLGNILKWITSPVSERQWEHLEWSNTPRWAVSGSIDASGAYRNLYLVDLETGEDTRIASGQELWQPALWVGDTLINDGKWRADRDSLADYGTPELDFRYGTWWSRRSSIEAVFLGSSHPSNGILPSKIHSVVGHQLAFAGSIVDDQDEVLRKYVIPHAPHLRVVVDGFMPGWLYEPAVNPLRSPWYIVRTLKGYQYDRNHDFWRTSQPIDLEKAALARVLANPTSSQFDSTGEYNAYSLNGGWSSSFTGVSPVADQIETNPHVDQNLSILEAMVRDVTASGVLFVLVKFPESPAYAASPVATRYGPSWGQYRKLVARIRQWEALYPGFVFYDAYQDGYHDYGSDEAQNTDHLNLKGADKFSRRLDSVIGAHLR